jgi:hypothetical protein
MAKAIDEPRSLVMRFSKLIAVVADYGNISWEP